MAYSRFRPNRRFRLSRRVVGRRRSWRPRRRAYTRKWGRFSRGGRGRRGNLGRRVRRMAARKKHDLSCGGVSTTSGPGNVILSGPGNVYVLSCPTYLNRQLAPKEIPRRDYLREQAKIFYRGVREEVSISVSEPVFWRRVVFFMNEELEQGVPLFPTHPATGNPYRMRNMLPFRPEQGQADELLGLKLWEGLVGVDFSEDTRWKSPLSKRACRVVYDRTATINPSHEYTTTESGQMRNRTMWHPVNRKLLYHDQESGNDVNPSPWVSELPNQGNMYIMDIFSLGRAEAEGSVMGSWNLQSKIYWHED